jgi:hypothetical protein
MGSRLLACGFAVLFAAAGCGKAEVFGLGNNLDGSVVLPPDADVGDGTIASDAELGDGPPPFDAGSRDALPLDVEPFDVAFPDGDLPDASEIDAGLSDSGTPDTGLVDTGLSDSGALDADPADTAIADAELPDAVFPDAAPADAQPGDAQPGDAQPADALPGDAQPSSDGGPNNDAGPITDAGTPAAECNVDSDCGFFGHCEPSSHTCVDCLLDAHCGFGRVCDTQHGFTCRVPCFNGQCGPLGFCEPAGDVCVECLTDAHCNNAEVCDPNTLSCVECYADAHCALEVGQPICDTSANECVECRTDADCTAPDECITGGPGRPFCAPLSNRGLCEPCDNDNQCGGANDHCIGYLGPTGLFDRACGVDCANNPAACPSGFECVSVRNGNAMQCRPRYEMNTPTCTATRHLGEACLLSSTNVDPGCGVENVQDARCVAATMTSTTGTCSVWCADNGDCANGTVCVGATPGQTGNCL